MSFVSSKPDPYPTPVDVVVYLISAIMNRVIKRFYCTIILFGVTLKRRRESLIPLKLTQVSMIFTTLFLSVPKLMFLKRAIEIYNLTVINIFMISFLNIIVSWYPIVSVVFLTTLMIIMGLTKLFNAPY